MSFDELFHVESLRSVSGNTQLYFRALNNNDSRNRPAIPVLAVIPAIAVVAILPVLSLFSRRILDT